MMRLVGEFLQATMPPVFHACVNDMRCKTESIDTFDYRYLDLDRFSPLLASNLKQRLKRLKISDKSTAAILSNVFRVRQLAFS